MKFRSKGELGLNQDGKMAGKILQYNNRRLCRRLKALD